MKMKFILLIVCFCTLSICPCLAQETVTYKGVLTDSITRKAIPDAQIYYVNTDTVVSKSKPNGAFQLAVRKGTTVRLRKKGYRWLNVEITEASKNAGIVEMSPSLRSGLQDQFDEMEVNGVFLPRDEWDDINPDYCIEFSVMNIDNKARLIIKTK